ncbi:MAG TPA: alpha/beta hydrolase-fold protein [Cyclobacteriaceae bacterium]|nr:alpha/beta hydrolase-fold protein [Cyclobacteriaceae bacterium]
MKSICLGWLLFIGFQSFGQDYSPYKAAFNKLQQFALITDSTLRNGEIQKWLSSLREANQIPFIVEDSVLFLYDGKAASVSWMGDFNGWGHDQQFENHGKKIGNTNLWFLKSAFPKDARLDYKIVLNGLDYILDPENPHQQWSGVGGGSPNSELRMPLWKEDPELTPRNDVAHGTLKHDILFKSKILGYQIMYTLYLPAGYEGMGKLPSVYVTDGYEYLLPQLGNMATILDNLIAEKKIKPIGAIFIDQREPVNRSNNKRMQELAMNKNYLDFFVNELIPEVEKKYPIISDASQRAIMGTSMGGLTSTYFAFTRPDVFGMAGIQSPAFWTKPQIYQLCENPANPKMKVSMTSGLINDTSKESRRMKDILAASSCEYHYREVNEGHSWGNWRNLIDDILIDFFALK